MQQHNTPKFFKNLSSYKIALSGILLSATLIVSLIESYIPPLIPVAPYAKIGFCNVFLMTALLLLGYNYAILMALIKCVFVALLSGNVFFLAYSIPASIVAYTISALLFKCPKISIIAISTISSLVLNFIETAISTAVIGHSMWLASPYILLIGGISGFCVGLITFILLRALPQSFYNKIEGKNDSNNDIVKDDSKNENDVNNLVETEDNNSEKTLKN